MVRTDERSGFTILYALGVLALLSTFALVFARVMGMEREASNRFVDGVRARLAARAGVERAVAELRRLAFLRHYSDPWGDRWGYQAVRPAGLLPSREVDLLSTTQPSFVETDAARPMFGSPMAVSGKLGDTYGTGDLVVYKLRVIDCAAQLNLNHPDPASIQRMLSALLQSPAGLGMAQGQADATAQTLIAGRPPGGFSSKTEVGSRLVAGGMTEPDWKKIADDLTVHGWVDGSVIRPWNLNGVAVSALEPLPRPPINLNTASEPVLTALFAGVVARNKYGTFTIDMASARAIAQAIVQKRGGPQGGGTMTPFTPFHSWPEFEQWVDEQLPSGALPAVASLNAASAPAGGFVEQLMGWRVPYRDLIKAITNPNTTNFKFGILPNHGGYRQQVGRLVDKSDINSLSTEGCFDSMGLYEITSLGLVLHPDELQGMLEGAAVTHQIVVQVYRPLRLTTQDDFERNRALAIPGNTIPNNNASAGRVGMNLAAVVADWPGMVSWPNYSLARTGADRALRPEYPAAAWDGYLTLTNIIAHKLADPDFAAGFAEGVQEGIKVRAWVDPKDEFPTGQARIAPPPPPPVGPMSATMTAAANQPRLRTATNAAYAGLLDEDSPTPTTLFTAGAQLVNTGLLLSPDRDAAPGTAGTPRFVAYDSNNLDLVRGTSIRFWVQPLTDPYAHPTETLLSFVGSKDGTRRQVGFKVYKEALPTGVVNIVLEAVGLSEPDESGVTVDWNWATQLNGAASRIEIDVTPQPPYANSGLNPEWLPGSWHWVVVNIGPGKLGFDEETQYFASLQVDKKKATRQLFYKGNRDTPQGLHEYGELLGHAVGTTSFFEPLNASTINSGRARGWIVPRLLGDFYHCHAGRNVVSIVQQRFFGTPGDPLGPAMVFSGNHIPFFPWVDPAAADQNPPGTYVAAAGWPPIIPFPVLSYGHRAALNFYDTPAPNSSGGTFGGGGIVQSLSMWKTDPAGSWNASFPPGRHPMYGPDGTVTVPAPGFNTPSGGFVAPGPMSPDGHPGDAEYWIGLQIMWSEDHYDQGCEYCSRTPNSGAQPSIEAEASTPIYGENFPYAVHNSAMTNKVGQQATVHPLDLFRSWVRVAASSGGLPHPQGQEPNFPSGPPAVFPITYLDDDCHGCEACDVDGPVFLGGEPAGDQNYAGGGLAPIDVSTMAEAVFDNVVFANGDMARRTDWPGANLPSGGAVDPVTGAPFNYSDPARDFEDRFFETNLAASLNASSTGQGAIYHRALLELRDFAGRLGTMTWTSYDTRDDLRFEVGVWQLNEPSGTSLWSPTNAGLLSNPNSPTWAYGADANAGQVFAGTTPAGVLFRPEPAEGPSVGADPVTGDAPVYVLGIRLQDFGTPRVSLPAPLVQSPVFEDLTITVISDRPLVLHAEEGVEE